MKTKIEALDCPNCGAPLDVKQGETFTVCLYCDSSIRIYSDKDEEQKPVPHTEVPAEVINKVKELILAGKKQEAIDLYIKESGISAEDSKKAVEQISRNITNRILLERPLSVKGTFLLILFIIVFWFTGYQAVIAAVNSGFLKILVWVLFIFSGLSILSITRTVITSIKYLPGKWTEARIIKFVRIGERKNLVIFRLLLEVLPPAGEQSFRVSTNLPVSSENLKLISEGSLIMVKYLPKDKSSVIPSISELKKRKM